MPEEQLPDSALWLAEELALQLARAMESMTGESAEVAHAPYSLIADEIDPSHPGLLWQEQRLSLGPESRIWVAASPASWEEIGNRVLRSAGVEDSDPDSIRSTYLEIVNQALSSVVSTASRRARQEIACAEAGTAPPPGLESGSAYSLDLQLGDRACRILAVFSPAVANIDPCATPAASAKEAPAASKPSPALDASTSSIDLLLDVELPVSVSFGRAQLPLKDVIKLTTGSIVELNRTLSEPVEVIVNNCVIARGEVVVIEGNYGIRIKQVISRQERLRTLY